MQGETDVKLLMYWLMLAHLVLIGVVLNRLWVPCGVDVLGVASIDEVGWGTRHSPNTGEHTGEHT